MSENTNLDPNAMQSVSIELPQFVYEKLQDYAEENDCSTGTAIRLLLEKEQVLGDALDGALQFIMNNDVASMKNDLQVSHDELQALKDAFDGVIEFLFEEESELRKLLVNVIQSSLECWEETTGLSKIDLVEKSRIWRVYIDRGTYQTRTLDKYLNLETLPKRPNWRNVLKTAQFVLQNTETHPLKEQLASLITELNVLLRTKQRATSK